MFEIELKAWVDDFDTVKTRINELSVFMADFEKEDRYWFPVSRPAAESAIPLSGVRIRIETFKPKDKKTDRFALVSYKTKEVRDGIEINDEKEFVIAAPPNAPPPDPPLLNAPPDEPLNAFEELLRRLGLEPGISKRKQGSVWKNHAGNMTIELSRVDSLGTFIELEILAVDDKPQTVSAARANLMETLKLIGINENRIETRYYNEMLSSLRQE
ncbi:MAG: CYTH domain-containing protein [Spirochaetaceae bacterium]|nr:CYTH domain-containing protein [Spirochaetaceae bacterium]